MSMDKIFVQNHTGMRFFLIYAGKLVEIRDRVSYR